MRAFRSRRSATSRSYSISGLIDERFPGFGKLPQGAKTAILDVSQMSRLTSFGVRQWMKAIEVLPQAVPQIYLLGCPTFFVDQLNMVLNFGGAAQVVTAVAPFSCPRAAWSPASRSTCSRSARR